MAISHVNGITAANISAFAGVSKANISAINGITASFGGGGIDYYTAIFACGAECGAAGTGGQHWGTLGAGVSFNTSTVRSGARSIRYNPAGGGPGLLPNAATETVYVVRFYIYFATLPNTNTFICRNAVGATSSRIGLWFVQSTSKLHMAAGATPTVAGAGISVTTGQWYRIDLKLDQTSGAMTADGYVDGVALTQATTNGSTTAGFSMASSALITADYFFDDVVISATPADFPIGAGYVNHFIPTSDGAHNTGAAGSFIVGAAGANITNGTTDSYLLIDEVPLDDTTPDTNDYITQTTDTGGGSEYVEHVFGPASGIFTPTEGPRSLSVIYGYHAASTGAGDHTLKLNDNGTEDTVQAFAATGATTIRYASKIYNTSPASATNWHANNDGTDGDFRDLRVRFGYSTDGNPNQMLDCVMIEAEFSE